jgi:hypothetical protein
MELGRIMKEHDETARAAFATRYFRGKMVMWMLNAALASGLCGVATAQELMLPKTLPDLVAESDWITVADLVGAQPRRNARGNLIVTDYRFRVAQTLEGMPPGSEFVVTQGGGTLAGETHAISDTADLEVGQRYLVFVRPGRGEMFAPFVGGAQGVYLLSNDGKAMSLGGDRRKLDGTALIDQVRGLANLRGSAPARAPRPGTATETYPAKSFLPLALTQPLSATLQAAPIAESERAVPAAPQSASNGASSATLAAASTNDSGPGIDYYYEHRITPPAVINNFPHDWYWWPEDEYQMSKWNQYGGDVFHVYETPTGDWAWGNDRFDLAGWPSNDDMIAQFGEGWGADTLGITYKRWFGDDPIIEADTALNPAYCWTLDDRAGLNRDDACWGFRQTMLHELGHSWGLKHPWEFQQVWWDSVMNYSPKNERYPQLFADDTNAVRTAFAGPGIHDALISLYTTALGTADDQGSVYTPTQLSSLSLRHGDDIAAWIGNQFKIENLGTDDIVNPNVQFWLSQQRLSWDAGEAYLGAGSYISVPVFSTYTYWMPSLPIPATTATGNYWFAAYLPDADGNMNNNSAWADENVTVHLDNNPTTLYPETYWQTSELGYLGPAGDWTFEFAGEAGTTYYVSMCPGTGGWADFDTVLSISYFGSELAFDDDTCDVQSNIVWTAPYTGTFTITVGSYGDGYQGTFQLGYRRDIADVIFVGAFDG